jgi:UDP:flavonoid glycosyltransferase YjiC (YdhE family)
MNTVIACGGTGGHLFPGLAVAEALRARGHEVLLFISEKEVDALAGRRTDRVPLRKTSDRRVALAVFARHPGLR